MKKFVFLSLLFAFAAEAAEFQFMQNTMNGSCKGKENLVSGYVAAGSLTEKVTTAGERQYRNFFKQSTDIIDSCSSTGCQDPLDADTKCKVDFYAAAVSEINIYWVDFAQRKNCAIDAMKDLNAVTSAQLETALKMENKPAGCDDQHWNAIAGNLNAIKSLDQHLESYARQNNIKLGVPADDEVSDDTAGAEGAEGADAAGTEGGTPPPPPPVVAPDPNAGSAGTENGGAPPPPAAGTEAAGGDCVDCQPPPAAPAPTADIENIANELKTAQQDCCKIIEGMWKRKGRLTKGSQLTAEGCKEAMADDPQGLATLARCVKQGLAGAFNSLKDSLTSLFDLGTYSGLLEVAEMLSSTEGASALFNAMLKSQTTDYDDYFACLKPGVVVAEKCERVTYFIAGLVGLGKFTAWFKPIQALKASGMLGKGAKAAAAAERAAAATRALARTRVYELARDFARGKPGVTYEQVSKMAKDAGMGMLSRANVMDIAKTGRLTNKAVGPAMNAGKRAMAAASTRVADSGLVQGMASAVRGIDQFVLRSDISKMRQAISAVPVAKRAEAAGKLMDQAETAQKNLMRVYNAAKKSGDKKALSEVTASLRKIEKSKDYLSGRIGAEVQTSLRGLTGTARQQALNKYLVPLGNKQNQLKAQVTKAIQNNDTFQVQTLNRELERIKVLRATLEGKPGLSERVMKFVPPAPPTQCLDGNCSDNK